MNLNTKKEFYDYLGRLKSSNLFISAQRESIDRTSLINEIYTINNPQKIFPFCDISRGVDACVGLLG